MHPVMTVSNVQFFFLRFFDMVIVRSFHLQFELDGYSIHFGRGLHGTFIQLPESVSTIFSFLVTEINDSL